MSSNQNHLYFHRHTVSSWGLGSNVSLKCCSLRFKISSDSSSWFILQTFYYFQCFVEQKWFHLIGIICGLAIYNSTVVDLHFPLALYKKLLDVLPTLEDLKELSPTEARSHELQLLFKIRSQSSVPTPKISLLHKRKCPHLFRHTNARLPSGNTVLHNRSTYCGGGVPLGKDC